MLFVDSPLDHVFLVHELAQFRKGFGSGCHPTLASVPRLLKLDLRVSPRLALRRLHGTTEIFYWRESSSECLLLGLSLRSSSSITRPTQFRKGLGSGCHLTPRLFSDLEVDLMVSPRLSIRWLLGAPSKQFVMYLSRLPTGHSF